MKKSRILLAVGALSTIMAINAYAAEITEEKAKSIALEHAGVDAGNIIFVEQKRDFDDGRWVYEIEFVTNDMKEYDYEIDAATGTIVSWDYDAEYYVRSSGTQSNSGSISLEDAKTVALNYAGLGASNVTWIKAKQDFDDGRLVYEIEFFSGSTEYEAEVDAATGMVIDWETERYMR